MVGHKECGGCGGGRGSSRGVRLAAVAAAAHGRCGPTRGSAPTARAVPRSAPHLTACLAQPDVATPPFPSAGRGVAAAPHRAVRRPSQRQSVVPATRGLLEDGVPLERVELRA